MITLIEAKALANQFLLDESIRSGTNLKIMEDETIEFELGWVFFYQSKEYIESGDIMEMLGGNSPIIVDKRNGYLHVTGTAYPVEIYIKKYIEDFK